MSFFGHAILCGCGCNSSSKLCIQNPRPVAEDAVLDLIVWLDAHFPAKRKVTQIWKQELRNPANLSRQDNDVDCGPLVFAYMKEIHTSR